jgi:hypothetical protein
MQAPLINLCRRGLRALGLVRVAGELQAAAGAIYRRGPPRGAREFEEASGPTSAGGLRSQ